ncbi:hypothetical protein AUEXF2481DRAFT_102554 [Aureobasidium subglaciale EXF-2481]|uniref:Rhodopsin domain-containing protein n=1 Tax=Aureobasidium subglaciale (strain EXF-2481) TaxID=1043005 RepID=A0A074XZ33_AURSE|nr:uncharacterized protein AUEXF2481DRAFT_102554 [Aureobasidium subglaciale EXF-2481]KAI5198080.1 hypothetical protein E4T38_07702 [Aureobasidium subglaciale]KAI5216918.1 hypothetical protein E4T40_07712 [Aureobasidium subglaciale]KAI5220179.1 hypothetical protein E4T41_07627 [Aureobasidium subglaciale]KAI5258193.1 hypothetical protein E4T46_07603 [Aureobasidium subglaciale]KEQ90808.1 hypothetical protein AUEXF2481DRAFT_102554 [Aureobasidium subglaciale EXF-2481]
MPDSSVGQVISWYICTIIPCFFLFLRLFSRWQRFGRLAIDDCFLILAAACLIGDLAIQQHMWNLGLGDMANASQEDFVGIMKMIVPGSVLYVSSLWCIKFALVIFYKKLAAPGSKMQIAYNFALAGLAVTFTTIFFDILFQCYPYDKRWSHDPSYQCSPKASRINYWITILFNIFSDLIIICLPITMVMKLQMKLKQRLAVAFIFALGGFVIIASIIRAIYSWQNKTMLTCTVSMVENGVAIIGACLPALRAIFLGQPSTAGNSGSYAKHYELSSNQRRNPQARNTTNFTSSTSRPGRSGSVDSDEELVRNMQAHGQAQPYVSAQSSLSDDKSAGIMVATTVDVDHKDQDSVSSLHSPYGAHRV